jgi:hypothetical protein
VTTLSDTDLAAVAAQSGWRGNDLDIAIAVALAESGGDTQSHNDKPPDDSYGLWQINMLGSMGTDRLKQFGLSAKTDLFDPKTNGRVAHSIQSSSGWGQWTTYTRGDYQEFMNRAKSAVASTDMNTLLSKTLAGGITAGGSGIASGLISTGQIFSQISNAFTWLFTPSNWLRIIEIGLGAALLIGGVYSLSKPLIQPVVSDVKSAASKVGKVAAVAAV